MPPRRSKPLTKNKRVKAVARERVGSPKGVRVLEERVNKLKPKHKKGFEPDGEGLLY